MMWTPMCPHQHCLKENLETYDEYCESYCEISNMSLKSDTDSLGGTDDIQDSYDLHPGSDVASEEQSRDDDFLSADDSWSDIVSLHDLEPLYEKKPYMRNVDSEHKSVCVLHMLEDVDVLHVRKSLCDLFVGSFEKRGRFLTARDYSIGPTLGVDTCTDNGSAGTSKANDVRQGVHIIAVRFYDLTNLPSKQRLKKQRRKAGQNERRSQMKRLRKKSERTGKNWKGKRRGLLKTRRKICRFTECLFPGNGGQSAGGQIGSCFSTVVHIHVTRRFSGLTVETQRVFKITRNQRLHTQVGKERDAYTSQTAKESVGLYLKKNNTQTDAKVRKSVRGFCVKTASHTILHAFSQQSNHNQSAGITNSHIVVIQIHVSRISPVANTFGNGFRRYGKTESQIVDEGDGEQTASQEKRYSLSNLSGSKKFGTASEDDESNTSNDEKPVDDTPMEAFHEVASISVDHESKYQEDGKAASSIDNTSVSPSIDNTSVSPSIDNTSVSPSIDNTSVSPSIDNTSVSPSIDNTSASPSSINESHGSPLNPSSTRGNTDCARTTVGYIGQKDCDDCLPTIENGVPGQQTEKTPDTVCSDVNLVDTRTNDNSVTASTEDKVSQNISDDHCLLDDEDCVKPVLDYFSTLQDGKWATAQKDQVNKDEVIDTSVVPNTLVQSPKVSIDDVRRFLGVFSETSNQSTKTETLSPCTAKPLSDKEEADDTNINITNDSEAADKEEADDSNIKITNDSEAAMSDSLNFFSMPEVPPEFRQWTVAMLRSSHGQVQQGQQTTILHRGLENEWNRLATFSQYNPPPGIYILPIANAGFFLPSSADKQNANVECAFCGVAVLIIQFRGHSAKEVHRQASPRCSFVRGDSVGNVSIAEIAETSGAKFLEKYPSAAGSVSVPAPSTAIPPFTPQSGHEGEMLMMDSEMSAVEGPADAVSSSLLPTNKPGSHFQPPAAILTVATALAASSRAEGTSGQQQQQQEGRQTAVAPVAGQTVEDARSTSPGQSVSLQTASEARSSESTDNANRTALPYQTARVSPPQSSTGNNPTGEGQNSGGSGDRGSSENEQQRQLVTYEELGIFSQRPKRPDMAVTQVRINTFEGWPHGTSHPSEEMAEAGFYYTGHADLVRCFHCKGGLKTWESSDKPWVEHARWFPRCPFVRLCKGQRFVDAVQSLNNPDTRPAIAEADVENEINRLEEEERRNLAPDVVLLTSLPVPPPPPPPDPSLGTLTELRVDAELAVTRMEELAERLEEENEEMQSTTLCKMCQTSEVNVLFLPCGHLVACAQCAPALRSCAMCRQAVKGSVRVHLDVKDYDDRPGGEPRVPTNNTQSA